MGNKLLRAGLVVGASALAYTLSFGGYGALRDRGWSPWASGAAVGAGLGAVTAGMMMMGVGNLGALKPYSAPVHHLPKHLAGYTAQRVAGCPVC